MYCAVLVVAVPQGGQLSFNDFAAAAASGRLAPSKGNIALSIQTPLSSGVARYLQPGQLVDVFVTYNEIQGQPVASNRTKHPLEARTLARLAAQYAGRGVIGFGLSNDERRGGVGADFRRELPRALGPARGRLAIMPPAPEAKGTEAAPYPLVTRGRFHSDEELVALAHEAGFAAARIAYREPWAQLLAAQP